MNSEKFNLFSSKPNSKDLINLENIDKLVLKEVDLFDFAEKTRKNSLIKESESFDDMCFAFSNSIKKELTNIFLSSKFLSSEEIRFKTNEEKSNTEKMIGNYKQFKCVYKEESETHVETEEDGIMLFKSVKVNVAYIYYSKRYDFLNTRLLVDTVKNIF